jgi:hypothetical protein
VTREYTTVLNGFAADIAPETFQLLTKSIGNDSPIAYIGVCIPSRLRTVTLTVAFSELDGVVTTQ